MDDGCAEEWSVGQCGAVWSSVEQCGGKQCVCIARVQQKGHKQQLGALRGLRNVFLSPKHRHNRVRLIHGDDDVVGDTKEESR